MAIKKYHLGCNYVLSIISGKWKPSIICSLGLEEKRYGQLKKYIEAIYSHDVTDKVLSEQLNQLVHDKIVHRDSFPTIPPKVVYSLTPEGAKLKKILVSMSKFGEQLAESSDDDIKLDYSAQDMLREIHTTN